MSQRVRQAARGLGKEIRRADHHTVNHQSREIELADVRAVNPLLLKLQDKNFTLDEDDLLFTAWIRAYDKEIGIHHGDTLAVKRMRDGEWLIVDVMAKKGTEVFGDSFDSGGGAGDDARYTHIQPGANTVWDINHDLGKEPAVQAFSTSGKKLNGQLEHIDLNNARITFNHANAGKATCN